MGMTNLDMAGDDLQREPQPDAAPPPAPPWPLAEAWRFLHVSERHFRRLIRAGKVRSIKIGERVLVPDAEVRRVAEHGT